MAPNSTPLLSFSLAVLVVIVVIVDVENSRRCLIVQARRVAAPASKPSGRHSHPIPLVEFGAYVAENSANHHAGFKARFAQLKGIGRGQPREVGHEAVNRPKNRYPSDDDDGTPHDHSLALLETPAADGSRYVNASYVSGYTSDVEFIATQGPLAETSDHHLQLVWEQRCRVIITLANCVENGKDKCHPYWLPTNDSDGDEEEKKKYGGDEEEKKKYGGDEGDGNKEEATAKIGKKRMQQLTSAAKVKQLGETKPELDGSVLLRRLELVNREQADKPPHEVVQLHYIKWPDHGVPESPAEIINLVRLFRSLLPPGVLENPPTVVHCAAGVGRTGSLMAIDDGMQCIEHGEPVNVDGRVEVMRLERHEDMVEKEGQYFFIHECLLQFAKEKQQQQKSEAAAAAAATAA